MSWMDIFERMAGSLPTLLGALVGALFTLRAAKNAARREGEREVRRDEKEVQNLLDALGVEIGTLWSFHMSRVGAMVEALKPGETLNFYYPLTQDYFTIYNSNAAKIGAVKNARLRESIVVTYNKCKKVVDGFKYNNELVSNYRAAMNSTTPDERRIAASHQEMIDYAQMVRQDHFELKGYVEGMLQLLEKR